ncbi:hypothetical protein pipiens_012978 [Culex pipiens pipiens]|uniref:Uncharacterized protein n=1 Tax=Culex pipiens pipiens TaxID=38569 RepID=A0ABD1D058_CULPP
MAPKKDEEQWLLRNVIFVGDVHSPSDKASFYAIPNSLPFEGTQLLAETFRKQIHDSYSTGSSCSTFC